jgi:curved DNA-binding protein CbpA
MVPNYYEILGLTPSAGLTEIRAAYKKLAFQNHPDLHPHDPEAEERFKRINEAYHVLSDPLKKSRYDARLSATEVETYSNYEEEAWKAYRYRQYARWQADQQKQYVFDRNYFKIQGMAFLVFLIIAAFSYGLIYSVKYLQELSYRKEVKRNQTYINLIHGLFASGRVEEAFSELKALMDYYPLEFRFSMAYDSMLNALRYQVQRQYSAGDFTETLTTLRLLKRYEQPTRFETLRLKAICEYQTQQYDSALATLEAIHKLQPWNFELVYQMGLISQDNLNRPDRALIYFNEGKKMFKESMARIYGEAFEVVMNPADVPDIYYYLFESRARANMDMKNYEEALTDCNWAVFLRPMNQQGWKMRALCRIALKQTYRLCDDLRMARKLGATDVIPLQRIHCHP